ncbi:MAG: helix-turn-helix transcriptional regulator [Eubacteriales bacterium]|uniref:helix-turn-helix domain-containing protein n=1 Tax=Fenollaria sp. TaxID=1965292 RepID=UPI002A760246|nr:helix-turn-helix transcriptional regulator [Fenollaria sp.]MDD7339731.1 helix-turn-helix transcriptional regulator [Eubacteriales bacterium]MDY3106373.1 helix-turn-helix transcriptional regulator [Fenollaria sp.]
MELGNHIKHYRNEKGLSQEELAERVYVTRQTISNWENNKNYPDINSIVLLSEVFEISIDNLIKGDLEEMKKEINSEEVKKLNFYSLMMAILMIAAIISLVPLIKFIGVYAFIVYFALLACALVFALKIEKIKKNNDIQTYKEIVAFTEGKRLDEIQKIEERAKRPYQKIVLSLSIAVIVVLIFVVMALLFKL